jgi:hypothetical protein
MTRNLAIFARHARRSDEGDGRLRNWIGARGSAPGQDRLPLGSQNRDSYRSGGTASQAREAVPLACYFSGVSDGIRTHDIQDHNLAL